MLSRHDVLRLRLWNRLWGFLCRGFLLGALWPRVNQGSHSEMQHQDTSLHLSVKRGMRGGVWSRVRWVIYPPAAIKSFVLAGWQVMDVLPEAEDAGWGGALTNLCSLPMDSRIGDLQVMAAKLAPRS